MANTFSWMMNALLAMVLVLGTLEVGGQLSTAGPAPCSPETDPQSVSAGNPNPPPKFMYESDADKETAGWCFERRITVDSSVTKRVQFLWSYKSKEDPLLGGAIKYGDPSLYSLLRGMPRPSINPEPTTELWYARTKRLKVKAYVSPDEAAAAGSVNSRISAAGQLTFEAKNEPYSLIVNVVSEDREGGSGFFDYSYTLTASARVPAAIYWSPVAFQDFYDELKKILPQTWSRNATIKTPFPLPESRVIRMTLGKRKEKPLVKAGSLTIRDENGEILAAFSAPAIVPGTAR